GDAAAVTDILQKLNGLGEQVATDPADRFLDQSKPPSPYTELPGAPKGAQFKSGGNTFPGVPEYSDAQARSLVQRQVATSTWHPETVTEKDSGIATSKPQDVLVLGSGPLAVATDEAGRHQVVLWPPYREGGSINGTTQLQMVGTSRSPDLPDAQAAAVQLQRSGIDWSAYHGRDDNGSDLWAGAPQQERDLVQQILKAPYDVAGQQKTLNRAEPAPEPRQADLSDGELAARQGAPGFLADEKAKRDTAQQQALDLSPNGTTETPAQSQAAENPPLQAGDRVSWSTASGTHMGTIESLNATRTANVRADAGQVGGTGVSLPSYVRTIPLGKLLPTKTLAPDATGAAPTTAAPASLMEAPRTPPSPAPASSVEPSAAELRDHLPHGTPESLGLSEQAGAAAFKAGRSRAVPRSYLDARAAADKTAWFRGWDQAKESKPQPAGTTLSPEQSHDQPVRRRDAARTDAGSTPVRHSAGAGVESPHSTQGEGLRAAGDAGTRNPAAGAEPHSERPAPTRGVGSGAKRNAPERVNQPTVEAGKNYRPTPADLRWQEKTPAPQRFEANVDAIRRAKDITETGRPVTDADRAAFARYSGVGATDFNDAFPLSKAKEPDPRLVALGEQLKQLLGPKEYASLSRSRLNAHYTTPTVIKAMWDAVQRLGADNLPSLMLKALYPEANVHVMGFERVDDNMPGAVPDNSQDIVISNVPFGAYGVADPKYAGQPGLTARIHNYFFVKGLDKARPGGLVAFITSHQTFDAASGGRQDFRRYLADRADLVGAIRLPQDAFPDTAVTTDVLFFRKRDLPEGTTSPAAEPDWIGTEQRTFKDERGEDVPVNINRYFLEHPEQALGEHAASRHTTDGKQSGYVLKKDKGTPFADQLRDAVKRLPENVLTPRDDVTTTPASTQAASKTLEGSFVDQGGKLMTLRDGELKPAGRYVERKDGREWVAFSDDQVQRIRDMLQVHDLGRDVLDAQLQGRDERTIKLAQAKLRQAYDKYVRANGPLHIQANRLLIRSDTRSYWLHGLERWGAELAKVWDVAKDKRPTTVTAEHLVALRSDLFSRTDLQAPTKPVTSAATPKDALMIALNERATLDFGRMSDLLGRPADEIASDLHRDKLIYRNPDSKLWELADEYLSGNIREKLKAAEAAAQRDPELEANVEALGAVLPADIPHGKIDVRLGTHWIPADDFNQFVRELLFKPQYHDDRYQPFQHVAGAGMASWKRTSHNDGGMLDRDRTLAYGTDKKSPLDLIEAAANSHEVRIYFPKVEGEPSVLDEKATLAAQAAVRKLRAAFKNWIWTDPARAARLGRFYNDTYNSWRNREYDGSHLSLPGSSPAIAMRPHQKAVVWRAITSPTLLMAHEVGYGKSMSMAAAAAEKKRLGLEKKQAFVVPNHLVGQMAREFWKLYPQANLLVPDKNDFAADGRATLMSRIATGEWDGVILPQSQLKLLPVHPSTALGFMEDLRAELQAVIQAYADARGGKVDKDDRTFKELQNRLAKMDKQLQETRDRLKAYQASHAHSLFWDDLGLDGLYVDEADAYKNLPFFTTMSRIKGLPNAQSDRAFDLH
ncbi:MAG: hypothetical protein E6J20_20100, partial [Chloroflexi bacterium]